MVTSGMEQHLFTGGRLSDVLAKAADKATSRLAAWPADDLLNTPEADVVDQLVQLATVEVPSLQREKAHLEPPTEVTVHGVDFGRQLQATVTRFTLVVPIAGDPSLFGMSASRITGGALQGEIDRRGGSLRLHCDDPSDAGQAKTHFERTLDQIEQRLEWTRADIERHNQQMPKQIAPAVAQRRAKLLKDRELQASIGYPIKK
jgi:hypothetical protein